MTLNIATIIPARMGSSRFPGKPLAKILGKPMIGHVHDAAFAANVSTVTAVATCDKEIKDYIQSIGGVAIMTDPRHERASDRCAEALLELEMSTGVKFDVVIMLQGDEPMISRKMLQDALVPFQEDPGTEVVNLYAEITDDTEFMDPNCIKVVIDTSGHAIYFSRCPIPHVIPGGDQRRFKQVCVIPFSRDFLLKYQKLSVTPLEVSESIDMLRVLEHGFKVRMVHTHCKTKAVDTPRDLEEVERLMQQWVTKSSRE